MSEIQIVEGDIGLKDPTTLTQDEKDLLFETIAKIYKLSYNEQNDLRWLIDYNQLLWTEVITTEEIAMRAAIKMDSELNGANVHIVPRVKFGVKSSSITMFSDDTLAHLDVAKNILLMVPAGLLVEVVNIIVAPDNSESNKKYKLSAGVRGTRLNYNNGYGRIEEYLYAAGKITRPSIKVSGEILTAEKEYPRDRAVFESIIENLRENYRARLSSWAVIYRMRLEPPNPFATKIQSREVAKSANIIELEKIAGRVFAPDGLELIADLFHAGLLPVLYNSADKKTPARVLEISRAREYANKNTRARAIATKLQSEQKMVILDKFGQDRYNKIMRNFALAPKNGILAHLTDSERKVVIAELATREKYARAIMSNKCAHLGLIREEPTPAMVAKLEEFVGETPKGEFVQCKVCNFDLMCPHLLIKYRMQTGRYKESEIRAALAPYSSVRSDNGNIYCNMCGEIIFVDIAEYTAVTKVMSMDDEETNEIIWSETLLVIRSMKFPAMIVLTKFVSAMKSAIYTHVYDMTKKAEKSKTSMVEEIKAKKKIYTAIYVIAWIIKFMLENKSLGIVFRDFSAPAGKELPAMIKRGVEILVQSHNITLKQAPGIDAKFILDAIITAYKTITVAQTDSIIEDVSPEAIKWSVDSDTILSMLYRMDCMTNKKIPKKLAEDRAAAITRLLNGHKFEAPAARNRAKQTGTVIYANAARPKITGVRANVIMKSWADMLNNIKNGLHLMPGYVNVEIKRGGPIETKMTPEYAAAMKSFESIAAEENKINNDRSLHFMNVYSTPIPQDGPWDHFPGLSRRRIWTQKVQSAGAIYDESGREHKWTIVIMADRTERKIADINLSGAPFDNKQVVDYKCGICGLTKTSAVLLDSAVVLAAVEKREMAANLFRFYAFRCPAAIIHEFVNNKCKLCGYSDDFQRNPNSDEAAAYFITYRANYIKNKVALAPPPFPVADEPIKINTPDWSFNFDIILELSSTIDVNHRVLASLGGFEKIDFKEVTSGKFIAPEPEDKHSNRITRLVSYAQLLQLSYNQLRNLYMLYNPPKNIITIVDDAGLSRSRYKELLQVLLPFDVEFMPRIHQFWRDNKPRDTYNFILQSICEKLLAMIKLPGVKEEFTKIFTAFARELIEKIIRGEELLTKPGYFNWNLIYAAKSDKEEQFDAAEEETVDDNAADDEEDTPVGLSAFDVEGPGEDDDDDDQNLIKVDGIDK